MLLATLCFAVSATSVSLEIPALPVPKLVAELSKATGLPLEASPDLEVDVVGVRLHQVPIAEVKQRLADLIGATWEVQQNREVLSRPPRLVRQQEIDEVTGKAKELTEIIARRAELPEFNETVASGIVNRSKILVDQLHERFVTPEHEKAREQLRALSLQTPMQRLLERLIASLDTKKLAALQPSEAIIYSSRPNRLQQPFDQTVLNSAVKAYQQEQALFRQSVTRSGPNQYTKADDSRYGFWEAETNFDKLLLKVFVNQSTGLPRIWLFLADRDGRVSGAAYITLQRSSLANNSNASFSGQFVIDQSAVEWNRLFFRMTAPHVVDFETKKPIHQLIEAQLPFHSNPEKHEPLAMSVGHAFGRLGAEQNKNVMALIPDRALTWIESRTQNQSSASFAATAEKNWIGIFKTEDNWITYRPRYLAQGRRERISRQALGNLFRETRDSKQLSISSVAQYAYVAPNSLYFPSFEETVVGYSERVEGHFAPKNLIDWDMRPTMKFLGSLSLQQLKTLLDGGAIPYNQLSSKASEQLRKFVYGEPDIMRGFFAKTISWTAHDWREILGSVKDEATEALPRGIPASTLISCEVSSVPVILRPANDEIPWTSSDSPTSFATSMAFEEQSEEETKQSYVLGLAHQINLKIDFGAGLSSQRNMNELTTAGRVTYKSWKQFPEGVRKQIESTFAKEREIIARRRDQGRSAPPPP